MIGIIEPEMHTKMHKKVSEKLGAKFFVPLHLAVPWQKLAASITLRSFFNRKLARSIIAAKRKGEKGKGNKNRKA